MLKKSHSRKAQAVLEMGLFGALILIVFSLLISYIQRLNDEQYMLMSNFRQALKKAHDDNAIVTYTTIEGRRHVDVNVPLAGKRTNLSASNVIHWGIPPTDKDARMNRRMYYKINEQEVLLGEDDQIGDIVFEYDTELNRDFSKAEANTLISTTQVVDIDEELTYILRDPDEAPIKTIIQNRRTSKQRTWDTGE